MIEIYDPDAARYVRGTADGRPGFRHCAVKRLERLIPAPHHDVPILPMAMSHAYRVRGQVSPEGTLKLENLPF
ncbi:MAG TPA: hypothetical protein VFH27_03685, partial [Longimicrobiaceae bacterium]|nr:hypothetical protein [Longimicrobiaceae bacterium]